MPFAARFSSWIGLSGRRYVFSVYPASTCPAFCHAVLLAAARDGVGRTAFQFVRHNARNETVLCRLEAERAAFDDLARRSAQLGAKLTAQGDEVLVE